MSSQRIHLSIIATHLTVVAAMLLAGSAALALAQTTAWSDRQRRLAHSRRIRPAPVVRRRRTRPAWAARGPGARPRSIGRRRQRTASSHLTRRTGDVRTPRIINDPTVGTSQTAETDLEPNPLIPEGSEDRQRRSDC